MRIEVIVKKETNCVYHLNEAAKALRELEVSPRYLALADKILELITTAVYLLDHLVTLSADRTVIENTEESTEITKT